MDHFQARYFHTLRLSQVKLEEHHNILDHMELPEIRGYMEKEGLTITGWTQHHTDAENYFIQFSNDAWAMVNHTMFLELLPPPQPKESKPNE